MGMSIYFYAVKIEELGKAPKGVQNFVRDFFVEKEIFGIRCMVAIGTDYDKSQLYGANAEDEIYCEGLDQQAMEDAKVYTWFDKHPEAVFKYHFI